MNKGESKSRRRKAVICILMAVVMVFSAAVSTASMLSHPDSSYNGLYDDIIKRGSTLNLGSPRLDMYSNTKTLVVSSSTIDISAARTGAVESEWIKLTVTGVAGHAITIATSDSVHAVFPGGLEDNPSVECTVFSDTIDADGKRTYIVYFNDAGSFTITLTDDDTSETDTVDITVYEKDVIFDVQSTVVIGERLTIRGSANTGTTVTVAMEDEVVPKLDCIVIDVNGEFEEEIDTSAADAPMAFKNPGSVRLKAYIDRECGQGDIGPDEKDDGSATILITRGDLTAELSTERVAQGDDFIITGTAKGSKEVDILIVAPTGYSGSNIEGGSVMYHASTPVTYNTFYKKISVGDGVETGNYLIMVLYRGSDSLYGKEGYAFLHEALAAYSLPNKTQDEMHAIIEDITTSCDDLLWESHITVETPFVALDPIASVAVGEPLVVTGTTNREEGYVIAVTVKGPVEFTQPVVKVENGTFTAIFDTSTAKVGTYTVQVNDGDGHADSATVEILSTIAIFDTGPGTYPSISGTHNGTITSYYDVTVGTLYTYSAPSTGGHTEYVAFYNATTGEEISNGTWTGYQGTDDYRYIDFNPSFILHANVTYYYTIKTGSYPQIIHANSKYVTVGVINCTEFTDTNGKTYNDWIPAILLE